MLIGLIIFVIILVLIWWINYRWQKELYTEVDILDVKTDDRILTLLRTMLKDVDALFRTFDIKYWADGGTLLGAVRHQGIIPWDDDVDICIDSSDHQKFLSMKNRLNEMGYGLTKFWAGYKIFPFSGLNIKYYNRNWKWGQGMKDLDDRENFDYLYPFIDVFVCQKIGDRVVYQNKYARRLWAKHWHNADDLVPLKRYTFDGFYINGPNNPIPYLDRGYGKDWRTTGYKQYDHENQRFFPIRKFRVTPTRDSPL